MIEKIIKYSVYTGVGLVVASVTLYGASTIAMVGINKIDDFIDKHGLKKD